MTTLRTILAALTLFAASAQAQTLKSLMYNSLSNTIVQPAAVNNPFNFGSVGIKANIAEFGTASGAILFATNGKMTFYGTNSGFSFSAGASASVLRVDLGFSTNLTTLWTATTASNARSAVDLGATWLTNTDVTNFRTAIGLGTTNSVVFHTIGADAYEARGGLIGSNGISFEDDGQNITRTNLGLGATNIVTFAGLTNNGNITINQTATNNGLVYIYRTNAEPFLGLANLIASNNTTISNETLFRVGVSEATNKSAQFGFRSTNTNGNGVAVFSVFGFNALMMVGADASTNAVIYSGGGTNNEVMTLIRDGATEFARPIRFSTNAATKPATNAPANTTNVAAWVEFRIGTNSYRAPLYQ